jgi:membrane protease YdiL (CAAX protease family)
LPEAASSLRRTRAISSAAPLTVVALGTLVLASRTVSPAAPVVVALVGTAGLITPLPGEREPRRVATAWLALAVGLAALLLVPAAIEAVDGGALTVPWVPATAGGVASAIVAAVAEEAFFRRLVYGSLRPLGVAVAVGVSTVLFAMVHVPQYGWATLPVNLGAGLVLGWQRWASGGWAVPAVTHAAANVMAFG